MIVLIVLLEAFYIRNVSYIHILLLSHYKCVCWTYLLKLFSGNEGTWHTNSFRILNNLAKFYSKFLEQSKEIKQNWTETENSFSVILVTVSKTLFLEPRDWEPRYIFT